MFKYPIFRFCQHRQCVVHFIKEMNTGNFCISHKPRFTNVLNSTVRKNGHFTSKFEKCFSFLKVSWEIQVQCLKHFLISIGSHSGIRFCLLYESRKQIPSIKVIFSCEMRINEQRLNNSRLCCADFIIAKKLLSNWEFQPKRVNLNKIYINQLSRLSLFDIKFSPL